MFYSDASIQRPLIISQKSDLLSLTILLVCVLYCFSFTRTYSISNCYNAGARNLKKTGRNRKAL